MLNIALRVALRTAIVVGTFYAAEKATPFIDKGLRKGYEKGKQAYSFLKAFPKRWMLKRNAVNVSGL